MQLKYYRVERKKAKTSTKLTLIKTRATDI